MPRSESFNFTQSEPQPNMWRGFGLHEQPMPEQTVGQQQEQTADPAEMLQARLAALAERVPAAQRGKLAEAAELLHPALEAREKSVIAYADQEAGYMYRIDSTTEFTRKIAFDKKQRSIYAGASSAAHDAAQSTKVTLGLRPGRIDFFDTRRMAQLGKETDAARTIDIEAQTWWQGGADRLLADAKDKHKQSMENPPTSLDAANKERVVQLGRDDLLISVEDKVNKLEEQIAARQARTVGKKLLSRMTSSGRHETESQDFDEERVTNSLVNLLRDAAGNSGERLNARGVSNGSSGEARLHSLIRNFMARNKPSPDSIDDILADYAAALDPIRIRNGTLQDLNQRVLPWLRANGYIAAAAPRTPVRERTTSGYEESMTDAIDKEIAGLRAQNLDDKQIWKKLARAYHPDGNGSTKEANQRFQYLEQTLRNR